MGMEADGPANGNGNENAKESGPAIPEGFRLRREDDGSLVLDLPIARDRFLRTFLPLFGLAFISAGILIISKDRDAVGLIPLGIGMLVGGFGAYLARGRLEIRLGADRLEWTRIFLRRWKTHLVERGQIASLGTQAGVRTNGRPTSWRLHYVSPEAALAKEKPDKRDAGNSRIAGVARVAEWRRRRLLPGFHAEASILWLGDLLGKWAQAPFDKTLDRSVAND